MKTKMLTAFLALMWLASPAFSQYEDHLDFTEPIHKNESAFTISLTSNGLALGGVFRKALPDYLHLGITAEFMILRDDKEFQQITYFGQLISVNDANRLFMVPINLELKKRLFANSIEDNFRPHIMAQGGVMLGMNFPKEQYINGNIEKFSNEYQVGYNAVIGFGVDIITRDNFFASIRPQYRFTYFSEEIANKTNHSAFEIKFELGGN
ncbi:MAG: hypothetical protein KDI06_14800 [Calditrichaeota bacterium]|nr:hypothetical protein [Calditrichota bacterium]